MVFNLFILHLREQTEQWLARDLQQKLQNEVSVLAISTEWANKAITLFQLHGETALIASDRAPPCDVFSALSAFC